jgi:hypothetical protein
MLIYLPALDRADLEGMIPHYERDYKIFKVNSQTGEVEAMKIREI